ACTTSHRALHSFPTRRSSDLVLGTQRPVMPDRPQNDDEKLVVEYRPLVERIVTQTIRQLEIEGFREDLVAYGMSGLLEARTRFEDRKSTRLNSSHVKISYAVF